MAKKLTCSFCDKSRSKVDVMIQGPMLSGIQLYICNECVDHSHGVIHGDEAPVKAVTTSNADKHTPETIKSELDKYIIGQDDPKVAMSVALYNHYKRIDNTNASVELDKSNMLMIGPSGSGKTLLVKTVARLFNLPYVIADATTLTESGYVGQDVEQLIELLLHNANGDVELAQKGIIFLDEIDKKSRKSESNSATRDVSGEGAQQALLKLIEGTVIHLHETYARSEAIDFDTKNVLFICSGAFVGLDKIVSQARQSTGIGFGAAVSNKDVGPGILKTVTSLDLIKYGMIPEFVGRVPLIVAFDDLEAATLVRILKEPKNSIVSQFQQLFAMDGVALEFDDKYLHSVAESCIKTGIGARGLRSIIEKALQSTQFMLPSLSKDGVVKVIVDSQGLSTNVYKEKRKRTTK